MTTHTIYFQAPAGVAPPVPLRGGYSVTLYPVPGAGAPTIYGKVVARDREGRAGFGTAEEIATTAITGMTQLTAEQFTAATGQPA